jgi:hypothetical protein
VGLPRFTGLMSGGARFCSACRSGRGAHSQDFPKELPRMAGLFRVPKPVVVPPPAPPPTETAAATTASHDAEAETARIESRGRARGGIAGTVATSARGVLTTAPFATARKSLLGE